MRRDAFSGCHPAVNFLFFAGAIGCAVVIQHPAYLAAGAVCAAIYYLLLQGRKGLGLILGLMPLFALLTAINPLFNTQGQRVLFYVFGRPYTFEALLYGAAVSGVLVVTLLWFGCYSAVMTGDKFTSLFGNLIPSLSLLLVMIFRMVPNLIRKGRQITGARESIGRGADQTATRREKAAEGLTVVGSLAAWALEGSIVTADSMRSRGYGAAKRTSFMIYRMTARDWVLLAVQAGLLCAVIVTAALGAADAAFTPSLEITPVSWALIPYCAYLLIPTALHLQEAFVWHISRSGI